MANLVKTWNTNANNVFLQTFTDPIKVYQESFLNLHQAMKQAGYAVSASSNGTTAANADVINSINDIEYSFSGNRTWAVYDMPSGYDFSGSTPPQIIIEASETPSDTTPLSIRVRMCGTGYDSSFSVNSLPSANDSDTFFNLNLVIQNDIDAFLQASWTYSDEGDLIFLIKQVGSRLVLLYFVIRQDSMANSGAGNGRLTVIMASSSNGISTNATSVFFNNVQIFLNPDGTSASSQLDISICGARSATNGFNSDNNNTWDKGLESSTRRLLTFPIFFIGDGSSSSQENRYLGEWVDVKAVSNNAPFQTLEDGDTDAVRYVHVNGGLFVPWESSQLPII